MKKCVCFFYRHPEEREFSTFQYLYTSGYLEKNKNIYDGTPRAFEPLYTNSVALGRQGVGLVTIARSRVLKRILPFDFLFGGSVLAYQVLFSSKSEKPGRREWEKEEAGWCAPKTFRRSICLGSSLLHSCQIIQAILAAASFFRRPPSSFFDYLSLFLFLSLPYFSATGPRYHSHPATTIVSRVLLSLLFLLLLRPLRLILFLEKNPACLFLIFRALRMRAGTAKTLLPGSLIRHYLRSASLLLGACGPLPLVVGDSRLAVYRKAPVAHEPNRPTYASSCPSSDSLVTSEPSPSLLE